MQNFCIIIGHNFHVFITYFFNRFCIRNKFWIDCFHSTHVCVIFINRCVSKFCNNRTSNIPSTSFKENNFLLPSVKTIKSTSAKSSMFFQKEVKLSCCLSFIQFSIIKEDNLFCWNKWKFEIL